MLLCLVNSADGCVEQEGVELAGDVALQASDDLGLGLTLRSSADLLHLYARQSPGDADDPEYAIAVADGPDHLRAQGLQNLVSRVGHGHAFPTFFGLMDRHVDAIGADRVLDLEWFYFGMLGHDPPDTYLHRRLATHPDWFMEILTIGFPSDAEVDRFRAGQVGDIAGDESDASQDQEVDVTVWFQAGRLADTWRVPPGLQADS